jgi:ATP-binding cassette subfamily B protein
LGISEAAEKIGFRTTGLRIPLSKLREIDLPCVLHWQQNHFVVLYNISGASKKVYDISDPAKGRIQYTETAFLKRWLSTQNNGISESSKPVYLVSAS